MLRLLVALEVVDVLDLLRDIPLEGFLQLVLALGLVDRGCGPRADGADLGVVALRLVLGVGDHDGLLRLLALLRRVVVCLLVLPEFAQHPDALA